MLERVHSEQKLRQIMEVLLDVHPSHNSRLWLVGFLRYCGYSDSDIEEIIRKHCRWSDYDPSYTRYQIDSIGVKSKRSGRIGGIRKCRIRNKKIKEIEIKFPIIKDESMFGKYNNAFFEGTREFAWQDNRFHRDSIVINPIEHSIYRSIEGNKHLIWFVDLDGDAEKSLEYARKIEKLYKWDFIKFSGGGFHLCKKLYYIGYSYMTLAKITERLYTKIKDKNISYTIKKGERKAVNMDPTNCTKRRLIRGYCLNIKRNTYAIPVYLDWSIDEIIKLSKDPERAIERYEKEIFVNEK